MQIDRLFFAIWYVTIFFEKEIVVKLSFILTAPIINNIVTKELTMDVRVCPCVNVSIPNYYYYYDYTIKIMNSDYLYAVCFSYIP